MKVIQLLNKIANGEEVPKNIKVGGYPFEYDTNHERYEGWDGEEIMLLFGDYFVGLDKFNLNDEIEVIEEPKKIEKIKSNGQQFYANEIMWIDKENAPAYCECLMNKINEIIDYINKGE